MTSIQPGGILEENEELGTVGVGPSVGHAEDAPAGVLLSKVLITKGTAVDGFTTSTIPAGKVTTLGHKAGDDTVKAASLVVKGLPGGGVALVSDTQGPEVLGGFGSDLVKELKDETAG